MPSVPARSQIQFKKLKIQKYDPRDSNRQEGGAAEPQNGTRRGSGGGLEGVWSAGDGREMRLMALAGESVQMLLLDRARELAGMGGLV
eukprot:1319409-Pyramimonas_sp.AAC.1